MALGLAVTGCAGDRRAVELEQLQVADEAPAHAVGQPPRAFGRAEHLVERFDLANEVLRRRQADGLQAEPLRPERHQGEAPVRVAGRLTDLGDGADLGHGQVTLAHLAPLADEHDAER